MGHHMKTLSTARLAAAIGIAVGSIGLLTSSPVSLAATSTISTGIATFNGSGIISFGAQRFDPALQVPGERAAYRNAADGRGLRFVQFNDAIEGDWLASLAEAGLVPLQYYPDNTYLVWADGSAAQRVATWPQVRWQGEYLPDWKLSPDLAKRSGVIRNVDVFFYNDGDVEGLLQALRDAGAKVINHGPAQPDKKFFDAWIEADAVTLAELSQLPQVVWLEYASPKPILDDEMSAQIIARNYTAANVPVLGYLPWLTTLGYNGNGVTWAVMDSGVDLTHPDLASRIIGGVTYPGCPAGNGPGDDNSQGGHGTHVAGIISGTAATGLTDAAGFKYGQGMAPGVKIFAQNPICVGGTPWPPTGGWQVLSKDAILGGATGANGSWTSGESGGTTYTAGARAWDQIARDGNFDTPAAEPFVMVFSAGNSGPGAGTLTAPKAAKNPIITASSRNYRVSAAPTTIDTISGFSSRGPTNDGRFGPTITTPGETIASSMRVAGASQCATAIAGTSNQYALCSGTSMASPHAAGTAAVLTQWWRDQHMGATPSPAMIKALLINGAKPMGSASIPNTDVGWGRVDLPGSMGLDFTSSVLRDQSALLTSVGQVWEATYGVTDTTKPLKISLAWTDAAAATGANPALVNNLDLEVVTNGQTYLGNVFASNVSTTGGSADSKNNTEGVIVANPGGSVTVRVKATNLPGDAVPGNATLTDQDFALVCRNCAEEPGFTLNVTPASQAVCAPTTASFAVQVGSILGYSTPVNLAVSGQPVGSTPGFTTNPVTPVGTSTLNIATSVGTAPGLATMTITGSNVDRSVSLTRDLFVSTALPGIAALTTPANMAVGQATSPMFTWSAGSQAATSRIQIATDAGFNAIIVDTTVSGTSYTPTTPLLNGQNYYWRVIGNNACGAGTTSAVYRFSTVTAPGSCEVGQSTLNLHTEDFSNGDGGYTVSGTGASNWALTNARPSPLSGGNAFRATDLASVADQRLTSPAISLPTGMLPLTLRYQNYRNIEQNGAAACYDSGLLEISVAGGTFTQVPGSQLINDPYRGNTTATSNPLVGLQAWCDSTTPRVYADTLVDLSSYAGSSVQLRWRQGSDASVGKEGWYVDDVRVNACAGDLIWANGFDSN